jgi:hypothetical protein
VPLFHRLFAQKPGRTNDIGQRCSVTRVAVPLRRRNAKPNLYTKKRRTAEPVSAEVPIRHSERPQATRHAEPTYAADLRQMLQDIMAREEREEEEERRLWALLHGHGRVLGGADKFGRVKVLKETGDRIDKLPGWMDKM